jgi:hypothetical protein
MIPHHARGQGLIDYILIMAIIVIVLVLVWHWRSGFQIPIWNPS